MKLAVCAGDKNDAAALCGMVERRMRELCADVGTESFFSTAEMLASAQTGRWPVLLLDADMESGGGIAAARRLREKDPGCQLIFYAADAAHALRSYPLHPVGYIIKPFDYETLIRTLDWCRVSWSAGLRSLEATVRRNTVRLLLTDILYAETEGRGIRIRARQTEIQTAMSLAEFSKRAGGAPFLRCHKSYIVNLGHVLSAGENCFSMDDGSSVPVSMDRRREVLGEFAAFRG